MLNASKSCDGAAHFQPFVRILNTTSFDEHQKRLVFIFSLLSRRLHIGLRYRQRSNAAPMTDRGQKDGVGGYREIKSGRNILAKCMTKLTIRWRQDCCLWWTVGLNLNRAETVRTMRLVAAFTHSSVSRYPLEMCRTVEKKKLSQCLRNGPDGNKPIDCLCIGCLV